MKLLFLLSILSAISMNAIANESGFMYQGQKHITYKDGKKVGPTFDEFINEKTKKEQSNRAPASTQKNQISMNIMYEEDELARCYFSVNERTIEYRTNYYLDKFQLFCVAKKN